MRSLLLMAALLVSALSPALSQAGESLTAADPAAAAVRPGHCSVLRAAVDRAEPEPERRDWLAANRDSAAAGGWRAYAQEAARTPARPPRTCPRPEARP